MSRLLGFVAALLIAALATASAALAADPLPALPPVPAPPPAVATSDPATGAALPSGTGVHMNRSLELPWSNPDHDPGRTGTSPVPGPSDPVALGSPWPFQGSDVVKSAPAIGAEGVAFVAADDGTLAAVASDASTRWTWKAAGSLQYTPALVETSDVSHVIVGASSGQVADLDPRTGTVRWTRRLSGVAGPVLARASAQQQLEVFAVDGNGAVNRLDGPTGGWASAAAVVDGPNLAVSPSAPLVYGTRGGDLQCLDANTGATVATLALGVGRLSTLAVARTGVLVQGDGAVAVVAPDCGHVLWSAPVPGLASGPAPAPDDGFYVTTASAVIAYQASGTSWTRAWSEPLSGANPGISIDGAGTAYVPAGARLNAFSWDVDPSGVHAAWSVPLPGTSPIAAPAIDGDGRLYVSQGARVHVLDERPAFKLAYADGGELYTQREIYGTPLTGSEMQLTHDADEQTEPSFSRDPGALAWTTASSPTDALATVGNGAARNGVTYPAPTAVNAQSEPALSELDDLTGRPLLPDGRRYAAFTDDTTGTKTLRFATLPFGGATLGADQFAIAQGLDAGTASTLARPGLATRHAAFSPDGTRIAWVECGSGGGDIVVLDLRGTPSVRRFGTPPPEQAGCFGRAPAFSPDSRWLVVESANGIAGVDLDGSLSFTSDAPAGTSYEDPSWSPDGTEIAVTLVSGGRSTIVALSGPQFRTLDRLFTGRDPSYHLSKFPRPTVTGVAPATPGDEVDVYGRGFDLIRPSANLVYFTHAARSAPVRATVVGARVDPASGRGVLRVRVPDLAGNGPLTVITPSGQDATTFTVLPVPLETRQPRSVPGARIRLFGRGFDLAPAASTRVIFPSGGGAPLYGTVEGGGVDGDREFLVVVVPDGVADGPIRSESNVAAALGQGTTCTLADCRFTRLHPSVTILRDDGTLAADGKQVTPGMTVHVTLRDIPVDPFFGSGRHVDLTVEPWSGQGGMDWKLPFTSGTTLTLPTTSADAVDADATATFKRSPDPAWDRWGDLDVWLGDADHPTQPNGVLRPLDRAYLQTPRMNIPIVFVPGTSGTPLDLNVPGPKLYTVAGHAESFPSFCTTCSIATPPGVVSANPAAADPQGPRVWLGPEMLNPAPGLETLGALCSQMINCATASALASPICLLVTASPCPVLPPHHAVSTLGSYPDILGFTPSGAPLHPEIGIAPGDPMLRTITLGPLAPIAGYPRQPIYEDLFSFLTGTPGPGNSTASVDSMGRPLTDARGSVAPRPLGSGPNGVYVFGYDWRDRMPAQADMLNTFIASVLARPDVASVDTNPALPGVQPIDKVVLITHSLGSTVARTAYLKKPGQIDQVISFGGGFGGVGETLKVLAMGDNWGIAKSGFPWDTLTSAGWGLAIQPWKTRDLAQNWPTAYEQTFNSSRWFDDQGTATTTSRRVDRTLVSIPGETVDSFAKLGSYLAQHHNPTLAAQATSDLAAVPLDDFRSGTGSVFHYRVVGENVPTNVGAMLTTAPTLDCNPLELPLPPPANFHALAECLPQPSWWRAIQADGDQTVPYKSAIGQTSPADDRVFVLQADANDRLTGPGTTAPGACLQSAPRMTGNLASACVLEHSDLPNYGVSLSLLNDILGGRTGGEAQSERDGLPFRSQNAVSENFGLSTLSAPPSPSGTHPPAGAAARHAGAARSADTAPSALPLELEVRGLVHLKVTDREGRSLGDKTGIPGAEYEALTPFGAEQTGNAIVRLPGDDGYDVELTAAAPTSAELIARHDGSGFSLAPTAIGAGTTLAVHVDPGGELPTTIEMTERGGTVTRLPLHTLNADGAADHEPPTSVAEVADGVLTVTAKDDGAGVRDVWAAIDGQAPQQIKEPLRIPDGAAVTVYATDEAGNVEPPHGPAGAPNPAQAVVSVVSGEATVDVDAQPGRHVSVESREPWLSAELSGDGTLRVSVKAGELPDGPQVGLVRLGYDNSEAKAGVAVVVDGGGSSAGQSRSILRRRSRSVGGAGQPGPDAAAARGAAA